MLINILAVFILMCFVGWVIELLYRSFVEKRLINPGFLTGPYLPIYGIGSIVIYFIINYTLEYSLVLTISLFGFLLSLIELITGLFFEYYYKIRLWDYTNKFLNFKGHICLEFSIYWVLLALAFKEFVYPIIVQIINFDFPQSYTFVIGLIYGIFLTDMENSFHIANRLRVFIKKVTKNINLPKNRIIINLDNLHKSITNKLNLKDKNKKFKKIKSGIFLVIFQKLLCYISNIFRISSESLDLAKDYVVTNINQKKEYFKKGKN
jgi:uncharacterized membrane protein